MDSTCLSLIPKPYTVRPKVRNVNQLEYGGTLGEGKIREYTAPIKNYEKSLRILDEPH